MYCNLWRKSLYLSHSMQKKFWKNSLNWRKAVSQFYFSFFFGLYFTVCKKQFWKNSLYWLSLQLFLNFIFHFFLCIFHFSLAYPWTMKMSMAYLRPLPSHDLTWAENFARFAMSPGLAEPCTTNILVIFIKKWTNLDTDSFKLRLL